MTRVAVLVLFVVAVVGGGWFVFHKAPQPMSDAQSSMLAERRARAVVVPDVRSLALVDAKSTFDQAGLAWEVVGPVRGFHTNVVVAETPAAGTRLVDTGTPLVKLRLRASGVQTGAPQQRSSVPGTAVEVMGEPKTGVTQVVAAAATKPRTPAKVRAPVVADTITRHAKSVQPAHSVTPRPKLTAKPKPVARKLVAPKRVAPQRRLKPVAPKPVAVKHVAPKPAAPAAKARVAASSKQLPALSDRTPAFVLPGGAHRERVGEMPLPQRADLLLRYLRAHKKLTRQVAQRWLVQHAWVATGARFGWWHGAEALQILIAADRLAEERWGVGFENEAIARQALAFVHAHEARR